MDNTSPSPQDRAPLIAIGRVRGALLRAVLVGVLLAVCLARNAIRTGRSRVPDRGPPAARKRLMAPAAECLDRVDVVYGLMIWLPHFEDGQENAHETADMARRVCGRACRPARTERVIGIVTTWSAIVAVRILHGR